MTTKSITELMGELDDTLVAYNEADVRSKDQGDEHDVEMLRLGKVERALQRKICSTPATSRDEAVLQVIVASHLIVLVAEGSAPKKKTAAKAHEGLISALSRLIELPVPPIDAATVRRQYFDTPFKRTRGMNAADLPALVAERNKIWHSNDGYTGDDSEKVTQNVCDQTNVLENLIADMVARSPEGILAQVELLEELTTDGASAWGDERDTRLMASIKAGLRKLSADAGGRA